MSRRTRKRKLEGEEQSVIDSEQECVFPGEIKNEMESMWEIPQIFHFLYLAREALNIPHLSMYEMERMLLIPRASKQLANIMTSLLSSPVTKAKLRKIPPMPYEFWTNILAHKMKSWFKIYEGKHRDAVKVLETIGVEPDFWNIFPDAPLLNGKDFEELSFKQRVWLLKTVCDTVMHTRKTVQEEIAKQPWEDQFETVLGTDRYGARYIYFPQFLKSDLRIYRHCLDNKILSTVKPVKPELQTNPESKVKLEDKVVKRKSRNKKRKRWCNGLTTRSRRSVTKCAEKQLNDCKCSSDSATGSLMNEDTNFSSTSTCSNNNNHINLDIVNGKRSRSLSKASEISTTSDETRSKTTRSSGYDTNSSIGKASGKKSTQKMFKGFSTSSNSNCGIDIITGILNGLKSENSEEKETDDSDISLINTSQGNLDSNSTRQYVDTTRVTVGESVDRPVDNLPNSSKTDDEKLNEIIGAEGSNSFHSDKKVFQISTASKSDDEKLSETRATDKNSNECCTVPIDQKLDKRKENVIPNGHLADGTKTDRLDSDEKKTGSSEKRKSGANTDNNNAESSDEMDLSLSELRRLLQKEAMDDLSYDEESEPGYNLRKPKDGKVQNRKQDVNDFNEMLLQLRVSNFQLVADSVESLRDLISSFAPKSDTAKSNGNKESNPVSLSEVKLVKRMTDLLSSLEKFEPKLRESMKKARGKLQKEWANFKEGSVEDQDSSGEGGLGSNWWILGSQGCPLPTPGDATLQTLSQPALSPVGTQNVSDKSEERQEERVRRSEQNERVDEEQGKRQSESTESKARGRSETKENGQSPASTRTGEETKAKTQEEANQETRRVLRARGVSSYTEQLYSDDEVEEDELEEWTDVEAVYAAPSTQTGSPTPNASSKSRQSDDWSDEEDSDQDWILPGSRKRKNKRPSINRRLKSFQHKIQSINGLQDAVDSGTPSPSNVRNEKDKLKIKETRVVPGNRPTDSRTPALNMTQNRGIVVDNDGKRTMPTADTSCNVDSVHSELDIKDEGPIYDTMPNQLDNTYTTNLHSNYVMVKTEQNPMNYYVMQPNPTTIVPQTAIVQSGPVVSGIMPPIQQGYYMQGGQNYIIHNPQPGFVSSPQSFQTQGPQMTTPQQIITHPGYMPYMVDPTQVQPGFMATQVSTGQVVSQGIRPNPPPSIHPPVAPMRPPQNRYLHPRQNFPHPNGAVIRSSMPIRGAFPRASGNAKPTRNVPQQRMPLPKIQKAKKPNVPAENTGQKTTSLIVLSDSDDEIEMIITEKTDSETDTERSKSTPRRNVVNVQSKQKPTVTPEVPTPTSTPTPTPTPTPKGVIPPQIIQRMNQGGISITPVRPAVPVQNTNTQLVVVVNETGSHYALSLPNGSKLILTPEQVAQIRASNGGKLIL